MTKPLEKLRQKTADYGGIARVCAALDCSNGTFANLLAGKRSPSLNMAFKLEHLFGIDAESWCTEALKIEPLKRSA